MTINHPMQNPALRPYLDDVRVWHGYVRFLGLPTIQDNPDTPISSLFVTPLLAEESVSLDSDPSVLSTGRDIFTMLKDSRRLVILGDPGGGKTTLLNWFSWLLVSGRVGVIPEWLEGVIPIPVILRELDLSNVETFDNLLDAFLKRPVADKLSNKKSLLLEYLREGKAAVLVDGFDEVPRNIQAKIRYALWEGFEHYPTSYFIATSRLVGYEDCPLDRGYGFDSFIYALDPHIPPDVVYNHQTLGETISIEVKPTPQRSYHGSFMEEWIDKFEYIDSSLLQNLKTNISVDWENRNQRAKLVYVMPFDNQRIRDFAHFWYQLRTVKQVGIHHADEFINAVFQNPTILRLARTPQLLTLMALVFRVRAQLPNGRALLYNLISEAYLESIDTSRKIPQDPYPWKEKRKWLARIGFEMQLLRTIGKNEISKSNDKDLLIGRKEVLHWIQQAMENSGYSKDNKFAEEYLNWIARRSGLLLPRGDELFSFLHLSFQEYFAALYIGEHLSDADWVISQRDGVTYPDGDSRVTALNIREWASDVRWQEVLIFCFEELSHSSKEARRLAEWIYGKSFSMFTETADNVTESTNNKSELLARIVIDPHTGLSPQEKDRAFEVLFGFSIYPMTSAIENSLQLTEFEFSDSGALSLLLSNSNYAAKFWQMAEKTNIVYADVTRLANEFIIHIHHWKKLYQLFLMHCENLNLESLSQLTDLKLLFVTGEISSDLKPLAGLSNLAYIYIGDAKFKDLSPLKTLSNLHTLHLNGRNSFDISPLVGLKQLSTLSLNYGTILDFKVLSRMLQLKTLLLNHTNIDNLSHLSSLINLKKLEINGTNISDLTPLARLHNLEFINLSSTPITDLSPLASLDKLKTLYLNQTKITNLSPLAGLKNLESLYLTETKVRTLAPLKHLKQLKIEGFKTKVSENRAKIAIPKMGSHKK